MNRLLVLVTLLWALPCAVQTQPQHTFAEKGQIELLLGQAERAFDSWELTITTEALLLGEAAAAKDRKALSKARTDIRLLKQSPDGFNGPMGFLLVGDLEDASRNAAVCGGQAAALAGTDFMVGQTTSGEAKLFLSQACTGALGLLSTVGETAFHMYGEVLLATDAMLKRSLELLTKCGEALKLLESKQPAKKP